MTDDQIIHDVLNTLNQWDKDNRDTTMSIPFYIKEKFKLEERKCFDLTTKMVNAGLVRRYQDNDYLIKDKGRQIADSPDGWLSRDKFDTKTQLPFTFIPLKTSPVNLHETYPVTNHKTSWRKWLNEKKYGIVIGTIIAIITGTIVLIVEYKSGFFIKDDIKTQLPTDTLSRRLTLKIKTVKQSKTADSLATRTNHAVPKSNEKHKSDDN